MSVHFIGENFIGENYVLYSPTNMPRIWEIIPHLVYIFLQNDKESL